MKFEFQASAVHRQWKDLFTRDGMLRDEKITFNIGNAPGFQRDTNAKMNAGIYVYDGESLTLNWQNWEPETLYRQSTSDKFVSKDNDFTITFGKHLSDLKLLGDDAHAQAVEETTAPASPAPAPPAPAPPAGNAAYGWSQETLPAPPAPAPPAPPAPAPAEQGSKRLDAFGVWRFELRAPVPEAAVEETAPAPVPEAAVEETAPAPVPGNCPRLHLAEQAVEETDVPAGTPAVEETAPAPVPEAAVGAFWGVITQENLPVSSTDVID